MAKGVACFSCAVSVFVLVWVNHGAERCACGRRASLCLRSLAKAIDQTPRVSASVRETWAASGKNGKSATINSWEIHNTSTINSREFRLLTKPRRDVWRIPKALHGAFFAFVAVRFVSVLPNLTAPHDFAFNKTAPNRTAPYQNLRSAPHPTVGLGSLI